MLNKTQIPQPNPQVKQYLADLYNQVGASAYEKSAIDKRMEKINGNLSQKIIKTVTVSEYFDHIWKQPDLKEKHKELVVKKVEAIKGRKMKEIMDGQERIRNTPTNLDVFNAKFIMSPFEEYNYKEKLKNIKNKTKLDMENDLFENHPRDLDILNAVNRPARLVRRHSQSDIVLHYTSGLCEIKETDAEKNAKAEEFVKKMQEGKKVFHRKVREIEKSVEARESEELARYRRKEQQEEEKRYQERKKNLETHIQILKAKSEARLKEAENWQENYKSYIKKKPLYKEIETKFRKGFIMPELEERKRKLQEIRDFHKPIVLQEIKEHEQKVMKILEERYQEKKEQLDNPTWYYKKPEFESKHHKTIAEELSKARRQQQESRNELLRRKEKVMELLQDVKDNRLPKIDPQKEEELAHIIEKLNKRKDGRNIIKDNDRDAEAIDHRKLGDDYLKSVKELVQKIKKEKSTTKEIERKSGDKNEETIQKRIPTSTKSETVVLKKTNYLAELRRDNKIHSNSNQIDLIIKNKNLDHKERKELLQSEIEKLEEKAKRRELANKYKIKRNAEDGNDEEDVDRIYVKAIRAKLEILGH